LSLSWVGFARIAAPRSAIQPDVASSNGENPSRLRSPAIALAPSYRSVVRSAGSAASRNRFVAASSPPPSNAVTSAAASEPTLGLSARAAGLIAAPGPVFRPERT
jgi:hypothetical protein